MGSSSVDSFIMAFSTRDPRLGGIAACRCFMLGPPGLSASLLCISDSPILCVVPYSPPTGFEFWLGFL